VSSDTPLLSLGSGLGLLGGIVYQAPITNYSFFDPVSDSVIVTTIYPVSVTITVAGMALLLFPHMRWTMKLAWPDGAILAIVTGDVEVDAV
jgi:hypothetical protein